MSLQGAANKTGNFFHIHPRSCDANATGLPYERAADREARINIVPSVRAADADEVCHSAESPVSTNKSPQAVTLHYPIAVKMSPMVPLSPASFATQAHIQVVGNANKPKLDGIQI